MTKALAYGFRITHIDNIPYVEKCGLVRADSPLRNPNYVSIGDKVVIAQRASREVNGYQLGECIPFYLGPRSPMLYVIQNGYNGVKKVDAEHIVYCIIRLQDIAASDKECIFTDGHALSALTCFYGKDRLGNIDDYVRYDDVYSHIWVSDTDMDLKRRKEAELLVFNDLEPGFVLGYVVFNEVAKQRLILSGIAAYKIAIRPGYYF